MGTKTTTLLTRESCMLVRYRSMRGSIAPCCFSSIRINLCTCTYHIWHIWSMYTYSTILVHLLCLHTLYISILGPPGMPGLVYRVKGSETPHSVTLKWTRAPDHDSSVLFYHIEAQTVFNSTWRLLSRMYTCTVYLHPQAKRRSNDFVYVYLFIYPGQSSRVIPIKIL